jgi:hypothetical protein
MTGWRSGICTEETTASPPATAVGGVRNWRCKGVDM